MIKLKHYHYPPLHFFSLFFTPIDHNNWFGSTELAGANSIYDFSSELLGWGAKLASAHLERAKCLLYSGSMHTGDYCDGVAAVTVVWL